MGKGIFARLFGVLRIGLAVGSRGGQGFTFARRWNHVGQGIHSGRQIVQGGVA